MMSSLENVFFGLPIRAFLPDPRLLYILKSQGDVEMVKPVVTDHSAQVDTYSGPRSRPSYQNGTKNPSKTLMTGSPHSVDVLVDQAQVPPLC